MIPFAFIAPERLEFSRLKRKWFSNVAFSAVNFSDLTQQIELVGEAAIVADFLTLEEKERFFSFSRFSRRVEWLSGRIAAKHAINSLCFEDGLRQKRWNQYQIGIEKSGRPYVIPKLLGDISISHSGSIAVAMATTEARCGIDIQKISEKIIRVQSRFAMDGEVSLCQLYAKRCNVDLLKFLTLLWSAKEALRKGIDIVPVAGFMELQVVDISGDLANGVVFKFSLSRGGSDPSKKLFQTCQFLHETYAVAIYNG